MNVLGISGWQYLHRHIPDVRALPLHDAAAALIIDGKLVAVAEEERFTRRKHGYDCFPVRAAAHCLEQANMKATDLDAVAVYWDLPSSARKVGQTWDVSEAEVLRHLFGRLPSGRRPKVTYVNHHLAHAYSAFACSPFSKATVVVVDGQGEKDSTTLWAATGKSMRRLLAVPSHHSLGFFYEALAAHLGFASNQPGKAMGLASYGDAVIPPEAFFGESGAVFAPAGDLRVDPSLDFDEQEATRRYWRTRFEGLTPAGVGNHPGAGPREAVGAFGTGLVNLAASAQQALEVAVEHLVDRGVGESGYRDVCIAGGVGLNCVMNGRIGASPICDRLFVQPLAHDAGAAIGAAAHTARLRKLHFDGVYLGPQFSDDEIERVLSASGVRHIRVDDVAQRAARTLIAGGLVGWFQGRMEAGPRALGNRSILADPRSVAARDRVNRDVKKRERWRPFAPSVLAEHFSDYFDYPGDLISTHMTMSLPVRATRAPDIAAAVHVDGTARPHVVTSESNPAYWALIQTFHEATGVPAVLNTSFNYAGEPLVCSPDDALRTFYSTGLTHMALGNFWIEKDVAPRRGD